MANCILLTNSASSGTMETENIGQYRAIGAYRIRTLLIDEGYTAELLDYANHFTFDQMKAFVNIHLSDDTFMLGISDSFLSDEAAKNLLKIAQYVKTIRPDVLTIAGGPFIQCSSFDCNDKAIDYVILNYAEYALLDILNKRKQNIINTHGRKYNALLEFQAHKLQKMNSRTTWLATDCIEPSHWLPIEITRGCKFKCAFCSYQFNGRKGDDYLRDLDDLRGELMYNYENFGVRSYMFCDDTYNETVEKISDVNDVMQSLPFKVQFAAYIKPELVIRFPEMIPILVESGLCMSHMGIESFNTRTRKLIHKGCTRDEIAWLLKEFKDVGVLSHGTFIVGLPEETTEQIQESHEFLEDSKLMASWYFLPLMIRNIKRNHTPSPIELNPGKYGYKLTYPSKSGKTTHWINDNFTLDSATQLATKLNRSRKYGGIGGRHRMGLASVTGKELHEFDYLNHYDLFDPEKMAPYRLALDSFLVSYVNTKLNVKQNTIIGQ